MWTGIAVAFAFLEVVAGVYPQGAPRKPEERVVAQVVTISQRTPAPTPPPTPAPTPKPTPQITPTPPPHYTLAPVTAVHAPAAKAAATPALHIGGAAAPKHLTKAPPLRKSHAPIVSLAEGKAAGRQNGGIGTGAGPGAGTGGLGGTGTGTGKSGNGNAGDESTAPCGIVTFEPSHLGYRRDGTVVQEVIVKVTTHSGDVEFAKIPWPFLYPGEKQNPFVHEDQLGAGGGVYMQQPPPGIDPGGIPALVQFVLKYTNTASGITSLPAC